MQNPEAGHAAPASQPSPEETTMTRELTPPQMHRPPGNAAHGNEPYLSGTELKEFLKEKAKTAIEITFISVIVAWAFIVPLFRDSLIQAIGNWLHMP
jgi:hypothetical protein